MFKELKKEGFKETEIFFEYKIPGMIVDIVGIKKDKKVAVEIGNLNGGPSRLKKLSKHFDKVIHIPYIVKVPEYLGSVKNRNTVIREIKKGHRCKTSLVLPIPKKFNFKEGEWVWLLKHGEKIIIERAKFNVD